VVGSGVGDAEGADVGDGDGADVGGTDGGLVGSAVIVMTKGEDTDEYDSSVQLMFIHAFMSWNSEKTFVSGTHE